MKYSPRNTCLVPSLLAVLAAAVVFTSPVDAAGRKKKVTSKIFIAEVTGEAQIDTGVTIDDLTQRSVYTAEGTVIETKINSTNALVFSNGTGIYFEPDTRLEIRQFSQEPFSPNRRDMEVEPSISTTRNFLPRGTVGICTSKMVAGSSMNYATPNANIRIRARKVVIQANDEGTMVSSLEGEVTVQAGDRDAGGQTIQQGQQAFIPSNGDPMVISDIEPQQMAGLDDKVTSACMARKKVYFDATDTEVSSIGGGDETGEVGSEAEGEEITAFDEADGGEIEVVAIPTTPAEIPPQFTVSAANLPSS